VPPTPPEKLEHGDFKGAIGDAYEDALRWRGPEAKALELACRALWFPGGIELTWKERNPLIGDLQLNLRSLLGPEIPLRYRAQDLANMAFDQKNPHGDRAYLEALANFVVEVWERAFVKNGLRGWGGFTEELTPQAKAIALLAQDLDKGRPPRTMTEYAEEAGCDKSTLSRAKCFQNILRTAKAGARASGPRKAVLDRRTKQWDAQDDESDPAD